MKQFPTILGSTILSFGLALTGCGDGGPVADGAEHASGPANVTDVGGADVGSASADGSAPANLAAPGGRVPGMSGQTASPAERALPAAFHGRWGMTPADCTSTRGDPKGLLRVSGSELRFYESVAQPARNVESSATSFSADFDFTGEGQSWSKFMTLQVQADRLIRTESSPMASFTYVRCT